MGILFTLVSQYEDTGKGRGHRSDPFGGRESRFVSLTISQGQECWKDWGWRGPGMHLDTATPFDAVVGFGAGLKGTRRSELEGC